jgi:hypothetical protein
VHCLALGGVDLTSPAGRMTMGVINAVARFERDLLIERTQSGLSAPRPPEQPRLFPARFSIARCPAPALPPKLVSSYRFYAARGMAGS